MKLKEYPKFYSELKRIPQAKRTSNIDLVIENLGYQVYRIPVSFKNEIKEKWTIQVFKKGKVLFDDPDQFFSFNKAVEYSRKIALGDFEFYS